MKTFSTSIQRRKRGKRTEYIARLTYYDKTGKRKGISKSAPTSGDAKRELQELINRHVEGGAEVLDSCQAYVRRSVRTLQEDSQL